MENLPEFIGNHLTLVTLFIAILVMLMWNIFSTTSIGINQIQPAELTRLINREHAVVIDVRSQDDFNNGHILNARNIPEGELQSRGKDLEKHRAAPVVACCGTGMTSQKSAKTLKAMGFEKIYVLKGGINAWQSANLPLTREG